MLITTLTSTPSPGSEYNVPCYSMTRGNGWSEFHEYLNGLDGSKCSVWACTSGKITASTRKTCLLTKYVTEIIIFYICKTPKFKWITMNRHTINPGIFKLFLEVQHCTSQNWGAMHANYRCNLRPTVTGLQTLVCVLAPTFLTVVSQSINFMVQIARRYRKIPGTYTMHFNSLGVWSSSFWKISYFCIQLFCTQTFLVFWPFKCMIRVVKTLQRCLSKERWKCDMKLYPYS